MVARSSLLRRPTLGARPARRTSSVVAALAALAPRLVRLARHHYPDGLLDDVSHHAHADRARPPGARRARPRGRRARRLPRHDAQPERRPARRPSRVRGVRSHGGGRDAPPRRPGEAALAHPQGRDGAPDRVRADRPGERRDRGLGRAPRPGVRGLPLAHRSAEGDRADLEARALSRRPGVDRAAVGRPPAGARGAPPGRLMSPERLLSVITVDILVILVVSRLLGVALRAIGQPQVMGEVIGGILLGPSLLGWAAPGVSAGLFPPAVLPHLRVLSEYGIVFFMFLVGLELDPALMRGRGRAAVFISHASIVLPLALGVLLAFGLYAEHAPSGVRFLPFALFMGASMSITAFPVLARILIERDLLKTKVGAVTIVCAAVDDVTAWCLLAFVVAAVGAAGPARGARRLRPRLSCPGA